MKNGLASDRGFVAASNYATVKAAIMKTISPSSRKERRQSTLQSHRQSADKDPMEPKASARQRHRKHRTQLVGLDFSN